MRERNTGRWCLSQGLKETISDESEVSAVATPYRVTLYCSSVPQRAGSSDSCTGPAHTHKHSSSVGSRGTQPPKLGSELCKAGWCHNTRTGHCKHQHHPCSLHTWAQPGSCSCPGLLPSCCPSSAPDTCTPAVPTACASELPTNCWHIAGAAPLPSTNREQGMLHFPQAKNRKLLYFPYMVRIKQKIVSKFGILQELSICLINIIIFTW